MKQKIAVISEGGAMRGAYVYGCYMALDSMFEDFSFKDIDQWFGSSASVATQFYLLSGQFYTNGLSIWVEAISRKEFINGKDLFRLINKNRFLEIDYLVDTIFRKENPLNLDKLFASEKEFYIPLANAKNAEIEIFSNKKRKNGNLLTKKNAYDVLKASISAPVVYDKTVKINGVHYLDGTISDPPDFTLIEEMKDSKKIIILTKAANHKSDYSFLYKHSIANLENIGKDKNISKIVYEKLIYKEKINYKLREKEFRQLDIEKKIIMIQPSKVIPSFDNSKPALRDSILSGFLDTMKRKDDIRSFLFKD